MNQNKSTIGLEVGIGLHRGAHTRLVIFGSAVQTSSSSRWGHMPKEAHGDMFGETEEVVSSGARRENERIELFYRVANDH